MCDIITILLLFAAAAAVVVVVVHIGLFAAIALCMSEWSSRSC